GERGGRPPGPRPGPPPRCRASAAPPRIRDAGTWSRAPRRRTPHRPAAGQGSAAHRLPPPLARLDHTASWKFPRHKSRGRAEADGGTAPTARETSPHHGQALTRDGRAPPGTRRSSSGLVLAARSRRRSHRGGARGGYARVPAPLGPRLREGDVERRVLRRGLGLPGSLLAVVR